MVTTLRSYPQRVIARQAQTTSLRIGYNISLNHGTNSDENMKTCIQSGDSSNDTDDDINLVGRPADHEGRIDQSYDGRDTLRRQLRTNNNHRGSQYEDKRCGSEHEHMSWRVEQGPFRAGERNERVKAFANEKHTHRSIQIEMKYTARNIPAGRRLAGAQSHSEGGRTVSETGVEVEGDGIVEQLVDFVE